MKTFIIDTDNNIVFDPAATSAIAIDPAAQTFATKEALMELAGNWPASRLVEIWNSFTDTKNVARFTSRTLGVARIWGYIQRLIPLTIAEYAKTDEAKANEKTWDKVTAKKKASKTADAKVIARGKALDAVLGVPAAEPVKKPATVKKSVPKSAPVTESGPLAKAGSKGAIILELIGRRNGATLAELMTATDWQKHSVRGFIAGHAKTKLKLNVISTKDDDGSRRYALGK